MIRLMCVFHISSIVSHSLHCFLVYFCVAYFQGQRMIVYEAWLKKNKTIEFRSLFRCISYNVHIVQHIHVLSLLYLSPSKYFPLTLMHFFILIDHTLKHCENSFFVIVSRCLVTLVLISLTPWKHVPLRIPFSFGKRKK